MERAYIHIAGPSRAGKTTLIERLLELSPSRLLVARCSATGDVTDYLETREKNDEELARYSKAGAEGVARYRFEPGLERTDAFWETELMEGWSDAVLFEDRGDRRCGPAPRIWWISPARGIRTCRHRRRDSRNRRASD